VLSATNKALRSSLPILHLYRSPGLSASLKQALLRSINSKVSAGINDIDTEYCFNIQTTAPLTAHEKEVS
jgi:hypothetical protein